MFEQSQIQEYKEVRFLRPHSHTPSLQRPLFSTVRASGCVRCTCHLWLVYRCKDSISWFWIKAGVVSVLRPKLEFWLSSPWIYFCGPPPPFLPWQFNNHENVIRRSAEISVTIWSSPHFAHLWPPPQLSLTHLLKGSCWRLGGQLEQLGLWMVVFQSRAEKMRRERKEALPLNSVI